MVDGGAREQKRHRLKDRREKRALKQARKGDTPEKQAERAKPGDSPSVADNVNRAGVGGFVSGSL